MAFNANFTRATVRDDGTLAVAGTSVPATGPEAILVSLVHGTDAMRSATVEHPHQDPWTAEFPPGGAPFVAGEEVFVVGVALRPPADPYVWQGGFQIKAPTDV